MHGRVPLDPQTNVSQKQFAIVFVPKRNRKRFSANSVVIKQTREDAIECAAPDDKWFAAVVIGPSKSSEGQYIYYLEEWISGLVI